jgi:hypothetical protein
MKTTVRSMSDKICFLSIFLLYKINLIDDYGLFISHLKGNLCVNIFYSVRFVFIKITKTCVK